MFYWFFDNTLGNKYLQGRISQFKAKKCKALQEWDLDDGIQVTICLASYRDELILILVEWDIIWFLSFLNDLYIK